MPTPERIAASALTRRGITVAEIRHALDYAINSVPEQGDHDLLMVIGPMSNGALIEVGILNAETDRAVVIHAMRVRDKYV